MTGSEDDLRELLRMETLWLAVESAFEKYAQQEWEELGEFGRIVAVRGDYVDVDVDDLIDFGPFDPLLDGLVKIFDAHVICNLAQPARITAKELADISIAQLTGISWKNPDEAIRLEQAKIRIEGFAAAEISGERVGEKRFSLGQWVSEKGEQLQDNLASIEIWSSSELSLSAEIRVDRQMNCYPVRGFLHGSISPNALPLAESMLGPVAESTARTVMLSATRSDKEKGDNTLYEMADVFEGEPRSAEGWLKKLAPLSFLTEGDGKTIIENSLDAYLPIHETPGDTLLERLRNATILLSHADQLTAEPLALSISFGAIEALVCEKDELPVSKQIKRFVATLLVQDSGIENQPDIDPRSITEARAKRRETKEKVLAKLYNIRCEVLHGNNFDASLAATNAVRRIASAVVRNVVVWRENQGRRAGGDTTWRELMDELNAASRKSAIVVGVPDLSELIPDKLPT